MSGVMRYAPNVEAALWFAREVWPQVRRERPDARFYLVGRDPDPAVQALHGKDGMVVTGTVEEPADWIAKAEVSVAPIRAAAGLQNKSRRRWRWARRSSPRPRPTRASGRARPGTCSAHEPDAFARAVLGHGRPGQAGGAGASGRRFVEAKWTWEAPSRSWRRRLTRPWSTRVRRGSCWRPS